MAGHHLDEVPPPLPRDPNRMRMVIAIIFIGNGFVALDAGPITAKSLIYIGDEWGE